MKLQEVTEKTIGEYEFFIRPFPALVSANLSGELANLLIPVIGSLAPLAGNAGDDFDIRNVDLDKAGPAIADAMSTVSGDKVESFIRKLLINYRNVSVSGPATDDDTKILDSDLVNEVFCGEIQDMFMLCFEVLKLNFSGFFKKLGGRFGNLQSVFREKMSTTDSESSTKLSSQSSN